MNLSSHNLTSINDLSKKDILAVLNMASSFREISERPIKKVPTLRGKTVINCFFEDSTRTRLSFEIAEKRLSADSVNISKSGSALSKGESLVDTAKNIQAMKADVLIIRHWQSGAPLLISKEIDAHVINAGDGMHEHPTQALLDLFTIDDKLGKMKDVKVGLAGDIYHSRVARSDIILFKKMGLDVHLIAPQTLLPPDIEQYEVAVHNRLEDIISELDVIINLRVQKERYKQQFFPSEREYARFFGLNDNLLKKAKPGIFIMHPGPVNRGVELTPEVADGDRSVILEQVTNGVAIRMAILYLITGGSHES